MYTFVGFPNSGIQDSKPGEIDLHGLYVKEAIARTDRAIEEAKQRGDSTIHLIVGTLTDLLSLSTGTFDTHRLCLGKGLHSKGGVAKIKPAIEDLMQK